MRRLLLQGSSKKLVAHPFDKGDICFSTPPPEFFAANSAEPSKSLYLATVVSSKPSRVTFIDDGSGAVYDVSQMLDAPVGERAAAKERYVAALEEAKRLAAEDSESIVLAAIAKVREAMGGTLGADGMISYTIAAGDESREGRLLCEALLAKFGTLASFGPAAAWMATSWREVCEEADADKSGTISEEEAAQIWENVSDMISSKIAAKVDLLGAPARLYRGDLCLAWPLPEECDPAAPESRLLATYMDATHVVYFDGSDQVAEVRAIEAATNASKEQAILRCARYTLHVP